MKQAAALEILKTGQNVFLTGSAGAGKTYTLNQYIRYLTVRRIPVAITASTGIAATHMGGVTIHSWSGIGIKDSMTEDDMRYLNSRKHVRDQINRAAVLIIDEISMLHGRQLDLINQVTQFVRGNPAPFGGLQVVLAGDFFQLPPIGKPNETNRDKFAFMSPAWLAANLKICYLTEQHRQKADELNTILNEIRRNSLSPSSVQHLLNTRQHAIGEQAPRLYTHNLNVDAINQQQLAKLDHKPTTFNAQTEGQEKLVIGLTQNVRAPAVLTLKVGAKVMFVKNNIEQGYMNGTLGEVIGFTEHEDMGILPLVKLRQGGTLLVEPETWSVENDAGESVAEFKQFPLCLAWAMTVHKSQGMTLEAAEIDLSQSFESGQGYVALSRLQSLAGLRLLGFNALALQLDKLASRADRRFIELSDEAEVWLQSLSEKALKKMQENFVVQSGGTLNKTHITAAENRFKQQDRLLLKTAEKPKRTASKSGDTLQETRQLFEQGLDFKQISEARGLSMGTIMGHMEKLLKQDGLDFDIERLRPHAEIMACVRTIRQDLLSKNLPEYFDGSGKLMLRFFVHHQLNGQQNTEKLNFNGVRLALMFIEREAAARTSQTDTLNTHE